MWLGGRSAERLYDRSAHGQSIDPLADEGAREDWLNLGASALGVASVAARGAAVVLAVRAGGIGLAARVAASTLSFASATFDAASAADAGRKLIAHWDELDGTSRAQLALTIGFWGVHALVALHGRAPRLLDVDALRSAPEHALEQRPAAGAPRDTVG